MKQQPKTKKPNGNHHALKNIACSCFISFYSFSSFRRLRELINKGFAKDKCELSSPYCELSNPYCELYSPYCEFSSPKGELYSPLYLVKTLNVSLVVPLTSQV